MYEGAGDAIAQGKSYGLCNLITTRMRAYEFTWLDTGIPEELEATRAHFAEKDSPNILEKADETIWFMENQVLKYSNNTNFIADRVKRSALLKEYIPEITGQTTHMYAYNYAEGEVLSKCVSVPIFSKLLAFSNKFWETYARAYCMP